jgi:predicted enzyme related to lactoylglutathione lyase
MPVRETVPPGAPIWVDLSSSDTDRSRAFYGGLFGWTADEPNPDFGGYANFRLGDDHVAGLMGAMPGAPTDLWSVYLQVDDAAAAVERATAAGSMVLAEPMAVGDLGTMAIVTDPGGSVIGMWQPGEHKGGVVATTGAPCHFELHTRAYDECLRFYADVFGWTISTQADEAGFRYSTLDVADGENAGIMDASIFPDDAPLGWSPYFAVDDMGAAMATVAELGGKVTLGPDDTPYGILAGALDSNGAAFKLRAGNGS